MIDNPESRVIRSALEKHLARWHRTGIPATIQAVDLVNRTATVYLKDEQIPVDKIPYDADLYLVAGDQVVVEVQGGRSYFIRSKVAPVGGAVPSIGAALFLIKNTILTVAAATVDFTNIPQSFRHLLLEIQGRGDNASLNMNVHLRFNNDSAGDYDWQYGEVSGAGTIGGAGAFATSRILIGALVAATGPASAGDSIRATIENYAATTFQKSVLSDSSIKNAASAGNVFRRFGAGWWRSTAAITQVSAFMELGNFVAGTALSLYGLR